jgi:hypothetical protein
LLIKADAPPKSKYDDDAFPPKVPWSQISKLLFQSDAKRSMSVPLGKGKLVERNEFNSTVERLLPPELWSATPSMIKLLNEETALELGLDEFTKDSGSP